MERNTILDANISNNTKKSSVNLPNFSSRQDPYWILPRDQKLDVLIGWTRCNVKVTLN